MLIINDPAMHTSASSSVSDDNQLVNGALILNYHTNRESLDVWVKC